jgi:membrane associated rhomboid family serine protease
MLWTRRVVVTYVLFGFNILLFLLMELAGGTTNDATVYAFGAKYNPSINDGEIWRFVTPIFIHIGIIHMFFNSYALWIIGPQVEKLYGGARFFILYLLAGIGGVVASYWYNPQVPSAGASGAIFGLFGVLLTFVIKYRNSIPPQFRSAMGRGIFLTVGINLVIGYYLPFIDNSAHIGGLVTGAALAVIIPYARPHSETGAFFRVLQVGLVCIVALSFVQVAAHYDGPGFSMPGLPFASRGLSDSEEFGSALSAGELALRRSFLELPFARQADFAKMTADLDDARQLLARATGPDRAWEALRREMASLVRDQAILVGDVEKAGGLIDFEHKNRFEGNRRQFEQLLQRIQNRLSQPQ